MVCYSYYGGEVFKNNILFSVSQNAFLSHLVKLSCNLLRRIGRELEAEDLTGKSSLGSSVKVMFMVPKLAIQIELGVLVTSVTEVHAGD